ncbi:MAG: PEP-CTERM sorting domain-containing protein [Armatimonadetes bacterium]|nr:PEP-CTERM sorting domain-containing protein [Armatimonadota bacterium]
MSISMGTTVKMLIILALLGCALAPASAEVLLQHESNLTGSLGSFNLVSVVSQSGGIFHYEYTLSYYDAYLNRPLTGFSVGNMSRLEYQNAGNLTPAPGAFADPVYNSLQDSIQWNATAVMPEDNIVKFWYDSPHGYTLVDVTSYGGAYIASGKTLGLAVPEPGVLSMFGVGIAGVGMGLMRKIRPRKR